MTDYTPVAMGAPGAPMTVEPVASYVIHRTEPGFPLATVAIETGISASGKPFHTVNVRDACTPQEAARLVRETLAAMNGPSEADRCLSAIVDAYRTYDAQVLPATELADSVKAILAQYDLLPTDMPNAEDVPF